MWNSNKSLKLSCICTRLVMLLVVVCAALLPKMVNRYIIFNNYYTEGINMTPLMVLLYLCCIPALAALFSLDRLLGNIKNEQVFTNTNVKYLRIISWCCFVVAVLIVAAGHYYFILYFVAVVAAFIGLIVRVVKNVIEQAALIKAENDFTI